MSEYKDVQEVLEIRPRTAARFCAEVARIFAVRPTEVGLLIVEDACLEFIFPLKLQSAGAIPLSSSAVAARTAVAGKAFLFNRFPAVPHHTVFERIKLDDSEPLSELPDPIQKLMSAPVIGEDNRVVGVIQVCRKGMTSALSGSDFSEQELTKLEKIGRLIAPYMQEMKATDPVSTTVHLGSRNAGKRASA
jgi:hypothetical protein